MPSYRRNAASLCLLALACVAGCAPPPRPRFVAEGWPSADRLFRSDPHWRGGDGAYSIGLGNGRVLWLFGDSFIKESGEGDRNGSVMIRNSAGIQEGLDPSRARMHFYWGRQGTSPGDFFTAAKDEWLWPGHGTRIGRNLFVFMLRIRTKGEGVFGFEPFGWTVFKVSNPDEPPPRWIMQRLDPPSGGPGLCSGSVLEWEGDVYAYCPSEPGHRVYLVRWNAKDFEKGDLSAPLWWTGGKWAGQEQAVPAFTQGQTELTIHYDAHLHAFVEAQSVGFGASELALRYAPRPEGPWSQPQSVYRPAESARKEALVYAGKAHPQLSGSDLTLTYASNAWEPRLLFSDESLYYPRFVRLSYSTSTR